jgi:hypothetical protein
MTMLLFVSFANSQCYQARPAWREKRLEEFWLLKFAEETKGHSTNVLVGMLKVVTDRIAELIPILWNTYHTRIISCFNFPSGFVFGHISQ